MKYCEGYLLDNRYRFERFIGSGTFGEVWVAVDTATDIEVALKVYSAMDEKGLEEFKKEFQISFEFNHTNLLHANYLGVNPEDRRPYLVMPYCPNGSVARFAGEMSENDLWCFIRDVAAGLAYLHSMNPPIIHQDIKPDNILILKSGDFVITDFGISKQLRATLRKSAASLNSAGAISYMGPERFSKQYNAVKASDIWSLGVSIFELATNELPFCGMGGSLLKQGAEIPDLPETYSETLNMICKSCLAKETWDRPTAAQLFEFTSKYINGENPVPSWNVSTDEAIIEETPEPEEIQSEQAEPAKEVSLEKKTVGIYQTEEYKQEVVPVSDTPVFAQNSENTDNVSVSPAVWLAVVLVGLLAGFILNLFL